MIPPQAEITTVTRPTVERLMETVRDGEFREAVCPPRTRDRWRNEACSTVVMAGPSRPSSCRRVEIFLPPYGRHETTCCTPGPSEDGRLHGFRGRLLGHFGFLVPAGAARSQKGADPLA